MIILIPFEFFSGQIYSDIKQNMLRATDITPHNINYLLRRSHLNIFLYKARYARAIKNMFSFGKINKHLDTLNANQIVKQINILLLCCINVKIIIYIVFLINK